MIVKVRALSRDKKAAFQWGDKETYSTVRARLKDGISEETLNQQHLRYSMWQEIQNVTGNKSRSHHV